VNEIKDGGKMADEPKRVSTEEAFHHVAEALGKLDSRLDNHDKQLTNHQETLMGMATLIDMLMIRTGLKKADPEASH
jgi:archaellum component FlaC